MKDSRDATDAICIMINRIWWNH